MTMMKIFDTSSLLLISDSLFEDEKNSIIITNITLKELENIKTSANKDANIKYAARQLLQKLDKNPSKYVCCFYKPYMENWLKENDIELNNDGKILAAAYHFQKDYNDECCFYTNDISLKKIASLFFNKIDSVKDNSNDYLGYKEIFLTNDEMANFYSDMFNYGKKLDLKINQYLNIYEQETSKRVDTLCWTSDGFRPLKYRSFISKQLGEIKPFKDDIYQAMAADSLINNKITMIKGPAGAGKSHLAVGFLFSLLDKGKIDKIIIFCNTVATKNAAKLGFYPGDRNEKLLDSQIGNFLSSKLGGKIAVEQFINEEKIILLPMSDIRGYDTSGMNAGIYIPEAQNLDIPLLKLALQRTGNDSIFILDGDIESQVDLVDYEGANNGMRRASKIFRGHDIYGEVTLKQIHRSKIAELASEM